MIIPCLVSGLIGFFLAVILAWFVPTNRMPTYALVKLEDYYHWIVAERCDKTGKTRRQLIDESMAEANRKQLG